MSVDRRKLPKRALIDTSVLIRALGDKPDNNRERNEQCREFFAGMLQYSRTILIAAPSIAEYIRKDGTKTVPRARGVEIVSLDVIAAEYLGSKFPESILNQPKKALGLTEHYIKYDALIVACAVRHKADCFVALDVNQSRMASKAGIRVMEPKDFQSDQTTMAFKDPAPEDFLAKSKKPPAKPKKPRQAAE